MLRSCCDWISRARGFVESPSPKMRSNAARGSVSIGQRRGTVAPRHRVHVRAAEARVAGAGEVRTLQPQLQRRERRLRPEVLRRDLIDRDTGVVSGGSFRRHARQPCRARDRMTALDLVRQSAQHQDVVAHGLERRQDAAELEGPAGAGRRPGRHDDAVRDVHQAEAPHGLGDRRERRECRHHGVEQWQRQRSPHPSDHLATRQ